MFNVHSHRLGIGYYTMRFPNTLDDLKYRYRTYVEDIRDDVDHARESNMMIIIVISG